MSRWPTRAQWRPLAPCWLPGCLQAEPFVIQGD